MAIELNDELVQLQHVADAAREAATAGPYSAEGWRPWLDAASVLQDAITMHAADTGQNRYELGKAVKNAAKPPAVE
ncbi:hypothetical protein [Streptomyces sp. NPDC093225]|uniref:hypothetical protein n=1 Tax=Streptomyces sp. NPDC093225 TaxID=3366034 RepID=UPI003827642F